MKWEVIKDKSKEHWLELRGTDGSWGQKIGSKKKETIWNYYAQVKWDGCIHLNIYSNGYSYDHECKEDCQCCKEYVHICDIGSFISTLLDLKEIATAYYQ